MTDSSPLSALRVPERHAPDTGTFDLQPDAVREWIRDLPLANVGETSRRLLEALRRSNRRESPPAMRRAGLELLRETLALADRALERHVVGRTFPLSDKQRRIAELAQVLQTEMAVGYKIVVLDLLRSERLDRHHLATAIHRAQDHLGTAMLKSCLVYAPYPRGAWDELHALFRIAETHGVLPMQVQTPGDARRPDATVVDGYLRILLLGSACLYRLRQGEQIRLARLLEDWASTARLTPLQTPATPDSDVLVVDLEADGPPAYLRYLRPRDPEACRILETRGLAVCIQEALAAQAQGDPRDALRGERPDPDTLRRLAPVWGLVSRRTFRRTDQSRDTLVTIGLHAAHRTLCRNAGHGADGACAAPPGTELADPRARFTSKNLPVQDGNSPDVWDMVYERTDPKRGPAAVTVQFKPSDEELDRGAHEWRMKNISAGGCCLLWGSEGPGRAQVGELVAIRQDTGTPPRWHVGVIRRMLAGGAEGLEIGVQLIAPEGVPAAVRGTGGTGARSVHRRALYLPGIDALQQAPSLILEAYAHRAGEVLTLVTADAERRLRLTQQVEDTGLFAQFQFDEARPGDRADPQAGEDDAFATLWPEL